MGLSYLLRIACFFLEKGVKFFGVIFGHVVNLLLTKFVQSTWLDILFVLFVRFYGKNAKKNNNSANIQPS